MKAWNKLVEVILPVIAKLITLALPKIITKWVTEKLIGTIAGGGIAGMIVKFFLGKILDYVLKELNSASRIAVNDAIDAQNRETYFEHKKQDAPEEVLVEDELNLINRGRKP